MNLGLNPDLNLSDGIHPNKDGTIVISRTIEEALNSIEGLFN